MRLPRQSQYVVPYLEEKNRFHSCDKGGVEDGDGGEELLSQEAPAQQGDVSSPYRGLGSFSSGNGVQTESGVFCSLNRPKKAFSMSGIEKAHTADPGMLQRKRNGINITLVSGKTNVWIQSTTLVKAPPSDLF